MTSPCSVDVSTYVCASHWCAGVLISSVKLIAFHGCFSWITFRAMALPLTYTVRRCCSLPCLAELHCATALPGIHATTHFEFIKLAPSAPPQASVASAVCALLPFVPTYAVALPGCVVLLAQGRLLAALAFFALHFMGYYIGDTVILEASSIFVLLSCVWDILAASLNSATQPVQLSVARDAACLAC